MDDLGATVHHMFQKVSIYDELKIELIFLIFTQIVLEKDSSIKFLGNLPVISSL